MNNEESGKEPSGVSTQQPSSPSPQTPQKVSSDAVKIYYESVSEAFRETINGQRKNASKEWLRILVAFLFFFSLIPVVPYVVSLIIPRFFPVQEFALFGYHVSLSSFWFWWLVCFVVFLPVFIAVIALSEPDEEKWLSPPQMRFGYAYGDAVEIRRYKTNRLPRHIELATQYLGELPKWLPVARTLFRSDFTAQPRFVMGLQRSEGPFAEFDAVAERRGSHRPRWYKLDPQTEKIQDAMVAFWPKLHDRLKDRKDLTAIESAVTDLANYLYTEIPEISDGTVEDKERLERFGMEALNKFAETINSLEPYHSEPTPTSREEKVTQGVVSTGQRLNALFLHPNIVLSFLIWLLLTSTLFSIGFSLGLHYIPTLKLDTTLLAVWVGGPIASSITAVTIPRVIKQRDKANGQV